MPKFTLHSSKRSMNLILSHTSNTSTGKESLTDSNLQIIILHLKLFYILFMFDWSSGYK